MAKEQVLKEIAYEYAVENQHQVLLRSVSIGKDTDMFIN